MLLNKELRETTHNANKMWDYILSRPLLPDELKTVDENTTKIKKAIEAISFMGNKLLAREKDIQELIRTKNNLEFSLKIVKQEKEFLKQNLDMLLTSADDTDTDIKSLLSNMDD